MKKTLYLLRHAKSSWKDMTISDFDRPLNKRGKHDAPLMAEKMRAKGVKPQMIISSPAKRARKTAKIFAEVLNVPLRLDKTLYACSSKEMIQVIQTALDTYNDVMIVGHNPELTMVNDILSDKEIFNIPTSGIVSIAFEDAAAPYKGKQFFFEYPKKYGGKV